MNTSNLKQLPLEERPRERLVLHGHKVLSAVELLAILLGQGTKGKSVLALAQEILMTFGSLEQLSEATVEELCKIKGLGKAKALQIKAALGIAEKFIHSFNQSKAEAASPKKVYLFVRDLLKDEKRECFGTVLLNAKGKMIRYETISVGTLTQTLVHPREVFHPAIRYCAASIILVHNHPSGELEPSLEDIRATQQLIKAGQMMNLPIQDHLIVSRDSFLSLRVENYCGF